jgi:hypothetical protein
MNTEDAANNIFVDLHAEVSAICCAMRGHPKLGLRRFISATASMSALSDHFGPGWCPRPEENNRWYFSFGQHVVEMQQGGRLQHDGGTGNAPRVHEKGTQAGDDTIRSPEVGSMLSAATEDPQLLLTSTDSATTERRPPGRASRTTVTIKWTKTMTMSRIEA